MSPSTEGAQYGSGTKVLLAEDADVRRRKMNIPTFTNGTVPSTVKEVSSKSSESRTGIAFHIKKFAWTLFTIPLCRAVVFVTFAVV